MASPPHRPRRKNYLQELIAEIFCDIKNLSSAFAQKFAVDSYPRANRVARLTHTWNAPELFWEAHSEK
jgi:hypothetical protein